MKLTSPLWKQNITRYFRKHWEVARKRVPGDKGEEKYLKERGFTVEEATEFVNEPLRPIERFNVIGVGQKPLPRDETHPDWKERCCHVIKSTDVLVEGLPQALLLTKTVHVSETLPKSIEALVQEETPAHIHQHLKTAILKANIFDSEQKKLPKIHDPDRPAFNFPRLYGITAARRNIITWNAILNILEKNSNEAHKDRYVSQAVDCTASFEKENDLIQIQSPSNVFLSSTKPLSPIQPDSSMTDGIDLPNIHPLKHTISIQKENFYNFDNIYPLKPAAVKAFYPHTTFLDFNTTQVKNLYETPITDSQVKARSLLHAFTVATSFAKTLYEKTVDVLPTPLTVQCIQSDGKTFHFGVLQLNTMSTDGQQGVKNLWYTSPVMQLFENCEYISARPSLEGYNENVYKYLNAFYHNT
ncbi:mitochondrial ribosomal protein L37 [Arctopsyche grandis]|uniref:mitochondrial ribosomal protein L37 n=1 Tax=Arctopsyche grandis TaxID=121162 RepID=UPI00406D9A11